MASNFDHNEQKEIQGMIDKAIKDLDDSVTRSIKEFQEIIGPRGSFSKINVGGITITPQSIAIYDDGLLKTTIERDGDFMTGSKIQNPAYMSMAIFANEQVYNNELMCAGTVLMGDNSPGKRNFKWDPCSQQFTYRTGQTSSGEIPFTGAIPTYVHETTTGLIATENILATSPEWYRVGDCGLTYTQYRAINKVLICPNGAVFVGYMGRGASSFLARASAMGEPFTIIDDYTSMVAKYSGSTNNVGLVAFGFNPTVPEQVVYCLTSAGTNVKTYIGSGTTFTAGATLNISTDNGGDVSYGAGNWMFTAAGYAKILDPMMTAVSRTPAIGYYGGNLHIRPANSGNTLHWPDGSLTTGTAIAKGIDNATSVINNVGADLNVSGFLASDKTGQYLMHTNSTPLPVKSSDGGTTWSVMSGLGVGALIWHYVYLSGEGTASHWLAVASGLIYYTEDFGTTWTSKLGNITNVTATTVFDLVNVRFTEFDSVSQVQTDGELTLSDTTANDANTSRHGFLLKATAPASGVRNIVAIDNTETVYKNTALVDSTAPANLAGTATSGTSLLAARRDHVHLGLTATQLTDLTDGGDTALHTHPIATGITGLGTGVATFLATPSSANLIAAVTDETGTGALVFANTPTLVTPVLGVATATSINKVAITAPATSATLTIADGKTLTINETLTLTAGASGQTFTLPAASDTLAGLGTANTFTVGQVINAHLSIGAGVSPNANQIFRSVETFTDASADATNINANINVTQTAANNSNVFRGFNGGVTNTNHAFNLTSATGMRGIQASAIHNGSGTVTGAVGYFVQLRNDGSGTITNAYNHYVQAPSNGGGGAITNLYGMYVQALTAGGTLNYALYTNAGLVHFGDTVDIASGKNLGIGTTTFGTSATNTLALFNGTVPSTSPADTVQLFSVDLSAGNATLGIRTETAVVTESVTSDRTLSVKINGTTYKICLKS